VDIYEAVRQGLPVNIEELREGLDDAEGWAQEYELQFLDQSTVLLPYDLLAVCESALATETQPPDFWLAKSAAEPIVLGIDFGRKQDLTVCWADAVVGGLFAMTKEVLALARLPTPEQVEILRPRIRRATRVCLDYTGPGVGLGDYLVKEFGEWNPEAHQFGKIELVTFTNTVKVELFSKLRMAFEKRTVGIPVSREIREDLHSVARVATASGGVTYRAPHTPDGHADRATAKALAERARSWRTGPFQYRAVKLERRSRGAPG
jgi:phage FluMu gp28-like protein